MCGQCGNATGRRVLLESLTGETRLSRPDSCQLLFLFFLSLVIPVGIVQKPWPEHYNPLNINLAPTQTITLQEAQMISNLHGSWSLLPKFIKVPPGMPSRRPNCLCLVTLGTPLRNKLVLGQLVALRGPGDEDTIKAGRGRDWQLLFPAL